MIVDQRVQLTRFQRGTVAYQLTVLDLLISISQQCRHDIIPRLRLSQVIINMKKDRDIEKTYSTSEFVSKLRRLAAALESGKKFEIKIAGERIYVPVSAKVNIEHEKEGSEEEIEFQIKWSNK